MWISNNGDGSHDPTKEGSGLYWPDGDEITYENLPGDLKSVVFEDGLIWGGVHQDSIKVGGSTYRHGLQAGKILPSGKADDPSKDKYRVYKVREDWDEVNPVRDANNNGIPDIKEYEKDYREWPVEDGAPWIDVDMDGKFTRGIDKPKITGDEMLWYVSNDLDSSRTYRLYNSPPIGLEIQSSVSAFDFPGKIGNTVFRKYKIINKSSDTVKNMYFAMWSDADVGNRSDDYAGCRPDLNLGYVYNGDDFDNEVYKDKPPAVGYQLVQGPIVPSPNDSARYNGKWIEGYKNLPLTSFTFEIITQFWQPPLTERGVYNFLRGYTVEGNNYIDPYTGEPVKYVVQGNPVEGTGWYEGEGYPGGPSPGERKIYSPTGPVNMAPGDTQVVVFSTQVAQGENRLESVAELWKSAKAVQHFYNLNYNYASPPPKPKLEQYTNKDSVYLYWQDNAESYSKEDFLADDSVSESYGFEGYRIWQFSDSSGSNPKLITTFDKANELSEFYGVDEVNGEKQLVKLFSGANNGIRKILKIDKDHYTGEPLQFEKDYYFGITAFAYSDNREYPFLEGEPSIVRVRPSADPIDESLQYSLGDNLSAEHTEGINHGKAFIKVIDPKKFNGDNYKITFNDSLESLSYNLINIAEGDTLLKNMERFDSGINNRKVTDGFIPFVSNIGLDSINAVDMKYRVKELLEIKGPGGSPLQDSVNVWYDQDTTNFNSSGDWTIMARGGVSRTKFIWQGSPEDQGFGYTNYEIRFTEEGSDYYLGEIGFSLNALTADNELASDKLPFEVWDIGKTPNDPLDDQKLIIKILDGSILEQTDSARYINDDTYTKLPTGDYEEIYVYSDPDIDPNNLPQESGNSEITDHRFGGFVISGEMPEEGTVIRMNSYKPLTEEDVFEFTLGKPNTNDKQKAKQNINNISVYPNPFINKTAVNPEQEAKVTFTRLPNEVIVRIYTLGGTFVKRLYKNDQTERMEWDLTNSHGKLVSSGIFIAHLDMPGIGTKILKIGVVF
jgi:hypothetical protein